MEAAAITTHSQLVSQLTTLVDNNLRKAWHLLSLVHANGSPIRCQELASQCKFPLCLIESLCSMHASPLCFTPNRLVSITRAAFVAFSQFLWFLRSGLAVVPRSIRYVGPKASLQNVKSVYFRKRKRNVAGILMPPPADICASGEKYPHIVLNISTEIQTVCAKKLKQNYVENGHPESILTFYKNQVQLKSLSAFEGFTVEDEGGSANKAWYLVSLVHANGSPIRLEELATQCKFLRFTISIIESLCSMPASPLCFTLNQLVSITRSAFVAFTQFLWFLRSGLAVVPRSLRHIGPKTSLRNVTKVYCRKRKRNVAGNQILLGADICAFGEKYPSLVLNISTETQTVCAKKLKQNDVRNGDPESNSAFLENQVQLKSLPAFEGFTVEEEEGSGGSGTVYRAKRKCDGLTLALKCPHGNANRHHIRNERKMLEKFGGKNFIIKYEGSFKHGSANCLVLQHVEHEKPKVLMKEIDLFQLQWYGYCLFRSLATLHKQGVIHRDVKPGNFLFSRMVTKGYLIDFNLAMDMYKKYGRTDERPKEPIPSKGRKELISLAQKRMYGPNDEVESSASIKRKRTATPAEKVDNNIIHVTPMPLHSSGVAVPGAGLILSRGQMTNKKEGPCVGTKGFRAPEVLLKSPFQGPKIDVWSAGVTLLCLSTGTSPFDGDPNQNMIDIAKLRGSEELWEVARLHDRESSFPVQLLDSRYLPSKKLRDWFKLNTKRPELLEDLPRSFFDLVDKCLTVNPTRRISAESALKHEFLATCHEKLQLQRRRRRQGLGLNSDPATHL